MSELDATITNIMAAAAVRSREILDSGTFKAMAAEFYSNRAALESFQRLTTQAEPLPVPPAARERIRAIVGSLRAINATTRRLAANNAALAAKLEAVETDRAFKSPTLFGTAAGKTTLDDKGKPVVH